MADLQAGSFLPSVSTQGGYGLWLARSLCARVHGHTTGEGTTVRLHGQGART